MMSKGVTAAKATRTKKKLVSHRSRVFDKEGLTDNEMCPFEVSSHQLSVTQDETLPRKHWLVILSQSDSKRDVSLQTWYALRSPSFTADLLLQVSIQQTVSWLLFASGSLC